VTVDEAPTQTGSAPKRPRPRDAAASRAALLAAAQELFGQAGFERTTIREIGERAGVDAALIARYFGSKADLYIAAVAAESLGDQLPTAYEDIAHMASTLLARTDRRGLGPILQALIRLDTSEQIRVAARAHLVRRLVEPLVAGAEAEADGRGGQAQLRAEVAVAALVGITLGRSLGWFDELASVPGEEVAALASEALGSLIDGGAVG
jgi:AcrR family transcriptional regulator